MLVLIVLFGVRGMGIVFGGGLMNCDGYGLGYRLVLGGGILLIGFVGLFVVLAVLEFGKDLYV